jgi:formylmethanofuran dehydrogenase subunit E
MDAQQIMETSEFKRCEDFHGHVCPGLSIGFRAAQAAIQKLKESRAQDEEVVSVVENDACYADAVQVLTGCTFGKGNFIYRDNGKMVLSVFSRKTGKGVRVAMKVGAFSPDETHIDLMRKVMSGKADPDETNRFHALHFKRSCDILEMPEDDLFTIKKATMALPAKAKIEPSEPCSRCNEPTMRSKLGEKVGRKICRDCLEQEVS